MARSNPKQDMGTGSVKRLLLQLALPAVVGQVVNLLYNIVDRIYIGHIPEVGAAALTGGSAVPRKSAKRLNFRFALPMRALPSCR